MVEFVHPLAWAVTAEDAAKAITSRTREMRNFMLPPKFAGWRSALPGFESVCCHLAMRQTMESACRLSVGYVTKLGPQGCRMTVVCLGRGFHAFGNSPTGTIRFGRKSVRTDSRWKTGAHGTHPDGPADPPSPRGGEIGRPRGDHRTPLGQRRSFRHR